MRQEESWDDVSLVSDCNQPEFKRRPPMSQPNYAQPTASLARSVIVSTTFNLEGFRIVSYLGLVRGIIVRAPTIAQGFMGGLKNIIGGRIGSYTKMCEQARQQAYDEMVSHALALGANAIVGVGYDAAEVVSRGSATEVLCYGTAVVVEPSNG